MRQLNDRDLEDLMYGAAFLGSGGGAPLFVGRCLLQFANGPIRLVEVREVKADEWGATPFGMGAAPPSPSLSESPSKSTVFSGDRVLTENPLTGAIEGVLAAYKRLEATTGKNCSYCFPLEIGVANLLLAAIVASILNISLVDGDGAGRSIPQLEMTALSAAGLSISPLILTNVTPEKSDRVETIVYGTTTSVMERVLREFVSTNTFGGQGVAAAYSVSGKTLQDRHPLVERTVSLALEIGAVLRQSRAEGEDPVAAVLNLLNSDSEPQAIELFRGAIAQVSSQLDGGFQKGFLILKNGDGSLKIAFKNESLIAWKNGKPVAMAPDLICYLTLDGIPITNADPLNIGQDLVAIALKAPRQLRQDKLLKTFMPLLSEVGYEGEYQPIEKFLS